MQKLIGLGAGAAVAATVATPSLGNGADPVCPPEAGDVELESDDVHGDGPPVGCPPSDEGPEDPDTGPSEGSSLGSGNASVGAIDDAVDDAFSDGGSGVQASRGTLQLSTMGTGGMSRGWEAWVVGQGRLFGGSLTGGGFEGTVGAHVGIGPAAHFGVLVSYGDYTLTQGGTTTDTEALSYGPYFKLDLTERYRLDGYLAFASPNYTSGATSYSSARTLGGLNLRATYEISGVEIDSFLGVRGFSESLPSASGAARTITSYTGSIGSRATFNAGRRLRPYVSLAGEYNSFSNGLGTTTDSIAPRVEAGLDYRGDAGTLSINLDGGQLFTGTEDYGVALRYETSW